jgi:Domain of unknown function (DUF4321)
MPPSSSAKHRRGFHAVVLSIGFIVGGAFTEIARRWLPAGAVKEFLTTGVMPSIGPLPIDLVIIKFTLGPVALDVSLLSLVGVLVAYLIARSLF